MADDKILCYNDCVLRRSDLDILNGPYFLNDRIIEFCFSYLATSYPSNDILLVPPSISFWIANCPDLESLREVVLPLRIPDKKVVIFPVNDNDDVTFAEGGSHWSLLAYVREKNEFVHHDSFSGSNSGHAKRLCNAVVRFTGISDSKSYDHFIDATTPQQRNGYDCGLYVTAIAKIICEWHLSGQSGIGDLWYSALKTQVTTSRVSEMRNEILMLIKDLMAKK